MKIKTILFISVIFVIVFLIYLTTIDKKVYYLDLSIDLNSKSYSKHIKTYLNSKNKLEKYIDSYIEEDDRVTDLLYKIKENEQISINGKKQTIKNALIKADLVTLFIGLNDINYKVGYSSIDELYDYADSFLKDLNQLLKIIREYCKEDIILIGYYNSYGSYYEEYFDYINRETLLLAKDYGIKFIKTSDIYNIDNHPNDIKLSTTEHKQLANKIIEIIDDKILKK